MGAPDRTDTVIEITPEMIDAGIAALLAFDSRFATNADCVEDVFRSMWGAMEERGCSEGRAAARHEGD
jgi:hypothetical protein